MTSDKDLRHARIDAIIAEYLQTVEAGAPSNREQLVAQYPDLAEELRDILDQHDQSQLKKPEPPGVAREAVTIPSTDQSSEEVTLAPHANSGALEVGTEVRQFGDYELLSEIARGGMGVVYKARQISLNRIVALKMILAGQLASEEDVKRFYGEAEAAANLDHPGIVPIHEVGVQDGQHFFSMSYVEGENLAAAVHDGPLSPSDAAALVGATAEAIQYAHDHGVIHRDLKPANVLLDYDGQPRVTDFGLAKRVEDKGGLTTTGAVMGTPSFMSPEQAGGAKRVGPAADIYSLGAVLYTLLTGCPPFQASRDLDIVLQVLEAEPTSPRRRNREVDRNLETICLKCLEKEPQRRYGSAKDLAADLDRYLQGEPIVARPLGLLGRISRWTRRRPALAITVAALGLFYVNHMVSLHVLKSPGEGGLFHWFVTGLLLFWLVGAAVFQYMVRTARGSWLVTYAWASMDVVLFTALLSVADGPKSSILIGYLLLVAGTALRFRIGLVWLITGLCLGGYSWLVLDAYWHRPQFAPEAKGILPFVLSLGVMGLIAHFLLRQSRRLDPIEVEREMKEDTGTQKGSSRRSRFKRRPAESKAKGATRDSRST